MNVSGPVAQPGRSGGLQTNLWVYRPSSEGMIEVWKYDHGETRRAGVQIPPGPLLC